MNEEMRIDTPETNTEALNDEKLEETAGGFELPRSRRQGSAQCPICGRITCTHMGTKRV